jgi:hypothetical protein
MFRFTIRDMLWLMLVVGLALGLGLGWWKDRSALAAQVADSEFKIMKYDVLMAAIQATGWRSELDSNGHLKLFPPSQPATDNRP